MNDVLPKPFTKEGLLNMLDKHLAHLKKMPEGMDMAGPPTASTLVGGTGAGAPGPAASSTAHSLKEESPPGQSPSTVSTANWHSPSQFPGISPASTGQHYLPGPVQTQGYGPMDQGTMQYPSPTTPVGGRPQQPSGPGQPGLNHRRQVSEMTGGDDLGGDAKRARVYATTNAAMGQMRRGPPG